MKYVYGQDKLFELTTFIAISKYLLKIIEIYIPTIPLQVYCKDRLILCIFVLQSIVRMYLEKYVLCGILLTTTLQKKVVGKYYVLVDSRNFLAVVFPKISFTR